MRPRSLLCREIAPIRGISLTGCVKGFPLSFCLWSPWSSKVGPKLQLYAGFPKVSGPLSSPSAFPILLSYVVVHTIVLLCARATKDIHLLSPPYPHTPFDRTQVKSCLMYDECPKRAVDPVYLTQLHCLMIFHPSAHALLTYFYKGK